MINPLRFWLLSAFILAIMPWDALKPAIVSNHPGSSEKEISEEPNWGRGHNHRIGYLNRQNRIAGLTHDGDYDPYETEDDREFREEALRKQRELRDKAKKGDLLNFRDIMKDQTVRSVLSVVARF